MSYSDEEISQVKSPRGAKSESENEEPVKSKSESDSDEAYKPKMVKPQAKTNSDEFKLSLKEEPIVTKAKAKAKAKTKAKSDSDSDKPKHRRRAKPKNPFVDVKPRRKNNKRKSQKKSANKLSADGLSAREQKQMIRYDADLAKLMQRHRDNEELYTKKGKFIYIATTDDYHVNQKYKIGFTSGPAALRKYSTTFAPGLSAYFICPGDKSLKAAILQNPKVLPLRQRNTPTLAGGVGRRSEWIVGLSLQQLGEIFTQVLGEEITIPVYPFA